MDATENVEIHEESNRLNMLWAVVRPSVYGQLESVNWVDALAIVGQLNQSEGVESTTFVGQIREAADALKSGTGDGIALRDRINEYESHRMKEWREPTTTCVYGFSYHDPRFGPYG